MKKNQSTEAVDHPAHYNQGKVEVIDAIQDWGLNFCEGNVIKYVARHRHKGEPLEDLKKAKWYLDRLIAGLENIPVGEAVVDEVATLFDVTNRPELWELEDPIQPDLGVNFKTAPGRGVFGYRTWSDEGYSDWLAFMCYAVCDIVPKDIEELQSSTSASTGTIVVPYTVWSKKRGAGRQIVKAVLKECREKMPQVTRVVTLSPQTTMARKFHLRNGAFEFRVNDETVNFEYDISSK